MNSSGLAALPWTGRSLQNRARIHGLERAVVGDAHRLGELLGGTTSFSTPGGGPSVDVSPSQILGALQIAFMGTLEGKKGKWGFWTDPTYVDLGASKSGTRDFSLGRNGVPVGLNADLNIDVKSTIRTLAGTYTLSSSPEQTVDLLAGARLLDISQSINWQLNGTVAAGTALPGRSGSSSISKSDWDGTRQMKLVDDHLAANRPYVLGGRFTLADIPVGMVVNRWFSLAGLERSEYPALSAYYELLTERPAFRAHGRNGLP